MYYLYTLNDENNTPKYVGVTNDPKERLHGHLRDKSNTPKVRWINSLKEGGFFPKMQIHKETSVLREVLDWEITAIAKYKDILGLVNSTEGGEYPDRTSPIDEFDMEGNFLATYTSMTEYCELHNWPTSWATCISSVCLRKRNFHKSRIFRYSGDTVTDADLKRLKESLHKRDPKHFFIMNLSGEVLGEFNSLQEAEKAGFGEQNRISEVLRELPGFNSFNGLVACYTVEDFKNKLDKYLKGKSKGLVTECISKYDINGNIIETYYTFKDALRSIENATNANLIKDCCDLKYKQCYGFQWRYGNSPKIDSITLKKKHIANSPIDQYDINGNFIRSWSSRREAADTLNISFGGIALVLRGKGKTAGGYVWKYKEAVL